MSTPLVHDEEPVERPVPKEDGSTDDLVAGETVIVETKPFFLSFFSFYVPGLYLFAVSLYALIRRAYILQHIPESFRAETGLVSFYFVLGLVILVPAIGYSFAKLNLRWAISGALALILAVTVKHKLLDQPWSVQADSHWLLQNAELLILALLGLFSVLSNELYRQSHRYLITTARIETSAGIFSRKQRVLPMSKINDLSEDQNWLGKIFGYGTLVPLTASGLGMGSDFAALAGSTSTKWFGLPTISLHLAGGHSIQVPKSRTHEALFGIHRSNKVLNEVMKILAGREVRMNQ